MDKKYALQYLPIFEEDLAAVRDYIAFALKNPAAAMRLLEDTDAAIMKRLDNPLGFEPYYSKKDRQNPYYRIYVRNYTVFYVVIGNIMEVRRFVFGRRDLSEII
jgi:hypothetical protein